MLLPAHVALGGLIGQSIMAGWQGFLLGSVAASVSDFEIFFPKKYWPQFVKHGRIVNRCPVEIFISNIFHSLFFSSALLLLAAIFSWQPVMLTVGLSFLSHWLTDAISHQRQVDSQPDYCPAFWPFSGHIRGLYDLANKPKLMIVGEVVTPLFIWLSTGLYTVLS